MKFKKNLEASKEKYLRWWEGKNKGRPLLHLQGVSDAPFEPLEPVAEPKTPEEKYLDAEGSVARFRNFLRTHVYLGDSMPSLDLDLGPGSLALYLGAEPVFHWDTVWYDECIKDLESYGGLPFQPENKWWKRHYGMIKRAAELSDGEFFVSIADIIENLDILAAMRGAQNLIFDMMDEPELAERYVNQIDDSYFSYYNALYDLVKDKDGGSCYTVFQIWGPGKTAKVQCDFSAMISPDMFREFALPNLKKQCARLDRSLYHLDGKDAIKHLDAVMEIKDLNALQWTCGAGQPDGVHEGWDVIYDKAAQAGKSLWIQVLDGSPKDWVRGMDRVVKKYGTGGLMFHLPPCPIADANAILDYAENNWK